MVKYLMFCVCVAAGYVMYSSFPVSHGPGITAQNEPKIDRLTWQEPFTFKGATLEPKRIIEAEVRVLDKKRYFFDPFSRFSPSDLVVGWKEMSDERNISYIYHTLSERTFESRFTKSPIEETMIQKQSDLWHLIPSTSVIDEKIKQLREGHIIKVRGLLVDVEYDAEFKFKTSEKLSDRPNRNGFVVWIEDFEIR
ncbi:hypothetical protein [Gracilimonas tropica]|uniref:hypothetical protein n=1 Tax=Gracilimonas tropica TaxID=454600 RepID=UPI0012FC3EFC|nr:hypothetical protein [Gracilimonas tropica]